MTPVDHYRSLYSDRSMPLDLTRTLMNTALVGTGSRERLVRLDVPFAVIYHWSGYLGWSDLTIDGDLYRSEKRRWPSSSVVAYLRPSLVAGRLPQIAWASPPTPELFEQVEALVKQQMIGA